MRISTSLVLLLVCSFSIAQASSHAIAMHGAPLYPKGFDHFHYVNPNAPKAGSVRFAQTGSFDSLNPLLPIGVPAYGIREFVYESLMTRGLDEPFTLYGLLAETIELDPQRRWIIFTLNPEARFSDERPVRAEDVIFSAKTLREHGRPNHRFYYRKIASIKKIGARKVKFTFTQDSNLEMPLIIGLMPILSKEHFTQYPFGKHRVRAPLGSGPYIISKAEFGKYIIYTRNKNYWGRKLAVHKGRFNFDQMIFEYYRDENTSFQAFKAGQYDMRQEFSPKRWALAYDFPAVKQKKIVKILFPLKTPSGMWAIVFNSRKKLLQNLSVRKALLLSFDGAWINKNLFYGLWQPIDSFWAQSELASANPTPKQLSPRQKKHRAIALFRKAGWVIKNNKMTNQQTGQIFRFEILTKLRQNERIALVWREQLRHLGIEVSIRFVDDSQYQRLRQNYDYDMIFARWFLSLSPGNEQAFYWGSQAAITPSSRNYAGIRSEQIDQLIDKIADAKTRKILIQNTQKLDRALLAGHYMIPLFYPKAQWVAARQRLHWPQRTSLYGYRIENWWIE